MTTFFSFEKKSIDLNDSVVIIPTYNEKDNISLIIKKIFSLIFRIDILIVDDSSPDGTADIVKDLIHSFKNTPFENRIHLIVRKDKLGLGTAYIAGFKKALQLNYTYIFEMDADFSHNPNDLVRLYNACKNDGYDFSIGSRYKTGVNVVNWPLSRVFISYFASIYVRMITGLKIADTTAGFVCYHRRVLEKIDLDSINFIGYAFQIEMKYVAVKLGFKPIEVPIVFIDRQRGQSKMSISIFKEAFFGVLQMRFKKYYPGKVKSKSGGVSN